MFNIAFDYIIKGPLYSKIYTEVWEDIADGGPTCFKELSVSFRAIVAVVMAIFQYCVLRFALAKVHHKYGKADTSGTQSRPNFVEKILGWASIILFCIQICYKFNSGKGIFMLNPCHIVLVLQAYVLLQDKSEKTQVMYANVVSLLFSPVCGILFAVDIGLDLPFEKEIYWIEHYLGAVINPLALAISGRFHERKFFHPYYRLIGFAFFSLYHRLVLLPLALATWANLDQTLCHAETDPFYSTFGDWYYLMADFYIPIASNLIAYLYLFCCEIVAFVWSLVCKRKAQHNHHQNAQNGVNHKEKKEVKAE